MGDGIQINRVAERFSSHTLSQSRRAGYRPGKDFETVRAKLIQAFVEVVGEGSDPRLSHSRARP
jgi:hypothetical protein